MAAAAAQAGETPAIDEDAAELQFPKEFELQDTKTLLISEVNILLEHRKQQVPYQFSSNEKCPQIQRVMDKSYSWSTASRHTALGRKVMSTRGTAMLVQRKLVRNEEGSNWYSCVEPWAYSHRDSHNV